MFSCSQSVISASFSTLLTGFRGGISAHVQPQDAAPCIGHAATWRPAVHPPPDPAAAAAAPAAAATDTRCRGTGECSFLPHAFEIVLC